APDVLVDRHPVFDLLVHHRFAVVRTTVARVIPRGIHERIHGVGFAPRRLAALWAAGGDEIRAFVERVPAAIGDAVFRQHHRQVPVRHRDIATAIAMNNRYRAPPVTLSRYPPVAQATHDLFLCQAFALECHGD